MSEKMPWAVHELGEDGDAWIASPDKGWSGGSENDARMAVIEYLHECVGDDADAFGSNVAELLQAPSTYASFWHWHAASEHHDQELKRFGYGHVDIEHFAGWLFSSYVPPLLNPHDFLKRVSE